MFSLPCPLYPVLNFLFTANYRLKYCVTADVIIEFKAKAISLNALMKSGLFQWVKYKALNSEGCGTPATVSVGSRLAGIDTSPRKKLKLFD